MNKQIIEKIKQGQETAFINHAVLSNLAYKPQFISNNYQEGRKVLSSIEDELLINLLSENISRKDNQKMLLSVFCCLM